MAQHRCLCYSNAPASQTWSFRAATPRGQPRTAFTSRKLRALIEHMQLSLLVGPWDGLAAGTSTSTSTSTNTDFNPKAA
ncbi:hypothetical protein ACFSHT_16440 [Paraburkholderia silviterrae]|uniref:Uncharacterized protein n=1 Tax=Paraburkholderia silviterrae TaxID=2528715 RepID=A0A4R5M953_9BURK|nr:hypothetical protein [Paraburkholderia silviterrae]TDG23127.1 hypothetical protein EYW47_14375 [Paraburkholderia silviterrae]